MTWAYKGVGVSRVRRDPLGLRWEARLAGDTRFSPGRCPAILRADTRRGMRKLISYYLAETENP